MMFSWFKNLLKRILPPPTQTFHREIGRVLDELLAQRRETTKQSEALKKQEAAFALQQEALDKQREELKMHRDEVKVQRNETKAQLEEAKAQREDMSHQLSLLKEQRKQIQILSQQVAQSARAAQEGVWANVFHDTIRQSEWLTDQTFSPGRWAIGYPCLCVLYRVLNEVRPKRILELGLGQSTRIIGQYAAAFEGVEHFVVEHDAEWICFFQNTFSLAERSRIVRLDREMVPHQGAAAVRVFSQFKETFSDQKFDFIMIDAPLGGDMKEFARIDVLGLLPECLSENFVLMIDDCERSGEMNTVKEIRSLLDQGGRLYEWGCYRGDKDMVLICSKGWKFLASL